jgi:hypothetical protein
MFEHRSHSIRGDEAEKFFDALVGFLGPERNHAEN